MTYLEQADYASQRFAEQADDHTYLCDSRRGGAVYDICTCSVMTPTEEGEVRGHRNLMECGPECILELQEAVTEAEMRANVAQGELIKAERRIEEAYVQATLLSLVSLSSLQRLILTRLNYVLSHDTT